ncbi:MAG: sensor histidine kinase [Planctomycetota bacterium]
MNPHTPAIWIGLFVIWGTFAGWQYYGYRHERALIQETLHQQSHSVMTALVGGIRSHRRLGRFFEEQLQGMLDELVKSHDVLAVAVASDRGQAVLSAGNTELLDLSPPLVTGSYWEAAGFRLVEAFQLSPVPPDERNETRRGPGWGRGRRRQRATGGFGPFTEGGRFAATLVLDRERADAMCSRSARLRVLVSAAGALVLACVALAWRASVRMVSASGRAQLLETEAKHLRELGQAAAGLAHETRNPLGLIRGWTQRLAQSDDDKEDRKAHAQAVLEECDRVTARINQFLAFARPHQPSLEPVDLRTIFDELSMILQPDLDAKNLRLRHELAIGHEAVEADRELLRQALFNLVQNAIHFSPEGEAVDITTTDAHNGTCRIEVANRGPDVPCSAVDSLFTPYFTTRPEGTGLGLAIVNRIATLHGWQAGYTPRPGGGSVFFLQPVTKSRSRFHDFVDGGKTV